MAGAPNSRYTALSKFILEYLPASVSVYVIRARVNCARGKQGRTGREGLAEVIWAERERTPPVVHLINAESRIVGLPFTACSSVRSPPHVLTSNPGRTSANSRSTPN